MCFSFKNTHIWEFKGNKRQSWRFERLHNTKRHIYRPRLSGKVTIPQNGGQIHSSELNPSQLGVISAFVLSFSLREIYIWALRFVLRLCFYVTEKSCSSGFFGINISKHKPVTNKHVRGKVGTTWTAAQGAERGKLTVEELVVVDSLHAARVHPQSSNLDFLWKQKHHVWRRHSATTTSHSQLQLTATSYLSKWVCLVQQLSAGWASFNNSEHFCGIVLGFKADLCVSDGGFICRVNTRRSRTRVRRCASEPNAAGPAGGPALCSPDIPRHARNLPAFSQNLPHHWSLPQLQLFIPLVTCAFLENIPTTRVWRHEWKLHTRAHTHLWWISLPLQWRYLYFWPSASSITNVLLLCCVQVQFGFIQPQRAGGETLPWQYR